MIDFHTHILPKMDDGSKSVEMSLAMIKKLKEQKAEAIALTPHYYFNNEEVERFIERRDKALRELLNEETADFPDLFIGAEVALFHGMSGLKEIVKLCIEGTRYMLLEMPYSRWSKPILREVDNLYFERGITPIIVHPERFISYQRNTEYIKNLLNMDVIVQMNCEALENSFFNADGHRLIKEGLVDIIGSDCHNMSNRAPNFDLGFSYIKNKFGKAKINEMELNGKEIIKDAVIVNKITSN